MTTLRAPFNVPLFDRRETIGLIRQHLIERQLLRDRPPRVLTESDARRIARAIAEDAEESRSA